MANIINNNALRGELRKVVQEEVKKAVPKSQIDALWKWMNKFHERIKILEGKKK